MSKSLLVRPALRGNPSPEMTYLPTFTHLVTLGLWAKSPCSLTKHVPNLSTLGR